MGLKPSMQLRKIVQVNSVLGTIHRVVANLVRNFVLRNNYLDKDDSWLGKLKATDFAVRSMYLNILQNRQVQLVF